MAHQLKIEDYTGEICHISIAGSTAMGGKRLIAVVTIYEDKIYPVTTFEVYFKKSIQGTYATLGPAIDHYNQL